MTIPVHPFAAGGAYVPSSLPLWTIYPVSSSTSIQAFTGVPVQSDANLWKNIDTATTSDYVFTPVVTGARGGAFRFPTFADTLQDHIEGYRELWIRVMGRSTGGNIDGVFEIWGDGDDDEASDSFMSDWDIPLTTTAWTSTYIQIPLADVIRLNGWPTTSNIPQLFAMWKPVTGATRSARYAWTRLFEVAATP